MLVYVAVHRAYCPPFSCRVAAARAPLTLGELPSHPPLARCTIGCGDQSPIDPHHIARDTDHSITHNPAESRRPQYIYFNRKHRRSVRTLYVGVLVPSPPSCLHIYRVCVCVSKVPRARHHLCSNFLDQNRRIHFSKRKKIYLYLCLLCLALPFLVPFFSLDKRTDDKRNSEDIGLSSEKQKQRKFGFI